MAFQPDRTPPVGTTSVPAADPGTIRVAVVADDPERLELVAAVLHRPDVASALEVSRLLAGEFLVVDTDGDLTTHPRSAGPAAPVDVAVLLAPLDGSLVRLVHLLVERRIAPKLMVLSADADIDRISLVEAVGAGADGWLGTDVPPSAMARTIRGVVAGEPGFARHHLAHLVDALRTATTPVEPPGEDAAAVLTRREQEIVIALTVEPSTRAVAQRLGVAETTVRWHTARLLKKLGIGSRDELHDLLTRSAILSTMVDELAGGAAVTVTDGAVATGPVRDVLPIPPVTIRPQTIAAVPAVVTRLTGHHRGAERTATSWASLAQSELRIVRLVAHGMTNREIASHLFLSKHTVDSHLKRAFAKLHVRSRVELTRAVLAHNPESLTG
ncbi:response regulator transcription factor [Nakamurella endophytica]|uniref:response regulator transcription factor n=1 Tax=Nakamurella endophytica TaxID=1748367 RepID=UPI00166C7395|nr:LuxR C-terminal-related transcriptional regulator [Nakamurella endophytica]